MTARRSSRARVALQPGVTRPGVVVVHGFNTNGKESVIRWAAMLYANGYNVIASDQRSFAAEHDAGYGPPTWVQTFGWRESEDVLAAGRYLAAQPGVGDVGIVGFSLGAQDAVLALALDGRQPSGRRVFSSGLAFSGPADQNTQIYSTAEPPFCQTPFCTFPATQALVLLVAARLDERSVQGAHERGGRIRHRLVLDPRAGVGLLARPPAAASSRPGSRSARSTSRARTTSRPRPRAAPRRSRPARPGGR